MKRVAATVVLALAVAGGGCGSKNAETTTSTGASCDPQSFLPVLQAELDNDAGKLHIATAEVRRCRSGYAQVAAVPDNAACKPGVEYCYDTVQVFLRKTDSEWHVINVGTGITCENEQDPEFRRACRALGYPG